MVSRCKWLAYKPTYVLSSLHSRWCMYVSPCNAISAPSNILSSAEAVHDTSQYQTTPIRSKRGVGLTTTHLFKCCSKREADWREDKWSCIVVLMFTWWREWWSSSAIKSWRHHSAFHVKSAWSHMSDANTDVVPCLFRTLPKKLSIQFFPKKNWAEFDETLFFELNPKWYETRAT